MLCATGLIALSTLCAKILGTGDDGLSAFQVTWGRYFFAFLGLILVASVLRPAFTKIAWPRHAVRVGCGWVGVTAMFAAATFIPLGDTTAITFTNPIFAMLLAIPILGERIGRVRWGTAMLALVGALLLIRPGTASFQPAALLALAAALLFGMEVVMLKLLSRSEPTFQVVLIANVIGVVLSSLVVVWFWLTPTGNQWLLMVATGLSMVCAQGLFTSALKQGDASFILPFSYATLLFAAFYDAILFDVLPTILSVVGGAVIVLSGIILAWREARIAKASK